MTGMDRWFLGACVVAPGGGSLDVACEYCPFEYSLDGPREESTLGQAIHAFYEHTFTPQHVEGLTRGVANRGSDRHSDPAIHDPQHQVESEDPNHRPGKE